MLNVCAREGTLHRLSFRVHANAPSPLQEKPAPVNLDPRTPVLVGVGVASRREADPTRALEALELMIEAVRAAGQDAGRPELLARAGRIGVPRGFWTYSDPGRLIADRIGASSATTVLAEIGVLQQSLLGDACAAIAEGRVDVAVVAGGEARYRARRAGIAGVEVADTRQENVDPDECWQPTESLWADIEFARGLQMPVSYFAVMESALRYHEGLDLSAHRDELARLYERFNRIAGENPDAWRRDPVTAEEIRNPSDRNPMIAFPYTRLHNSSWNVDQAAGLLFCSAAVAETAGVPRDRWVFPLASTESNHMLDLSRRAELHRCPAVRIAGGRALEIAEREPDALDRYEVYSCFPSAVRITARELELPADRALTVTGGMPFAGGPLNNYVLQATARMASLLREAGEATGLVTSVSGMLTKQGFGVWSTEAPRRHFAFEDCSDEVARGTEARPLRDDYAGPARVAGYTVQYFDGAPVRAVAVCDLPDGSRTVAASEDGGLAESFTERELCGVDVLVDLDGAFVPA